MTLSLRSVPLAARRHDRFEVAAEGLGRYIIDVSLPSTPLPDGATLPLVLVTDGNILFDIVQVLLHGDFATLQTTMPPSIIVGVGYPADEGNASWYRRRNFDFHDAWAMTDPLGMVLRNMHAMLESAEGTPYREITAGGYPRFMQFLRAELLPALSERYPVAPDGRHTLIGDSSGGHFALRALFDPISPFKRYVCVSPSFGAAEGAIQRAEAEYAANHRDLDADVFVCCGKVEVDQERISALCRFGSGVAWIAEQFAIHGWPSARLQWEVMNHEDHTSIAPRAIAAGLRSVHRVRPGVHDDELRRRNTALMEAMKAQTARSPA